MLVQRIIGVLKLDVATYEEIEHDQSATMQAAIVVAIVAIIGAIGSGILGSMGDTGFFSGFISTLISTFLGWIVWSAITYFVGTSLFGGKADMGEMLRVIGFAYAPQVLGIIPCIGAIVGIIWTLVTGFVAVRQGLDLDNTKAFLTIVIGLVGYLILVFILGAVFGVSAAAVGSLTG